MTQSLSILVAGVATMDAADPVLRSSLQLASRLGATLHLVHACTRTEEFAAALDTVLHPSPEADYQQRLRERLEQNVVAAGEATTRVVCHVLPGAAPEVLRDVASAVGADMLLVGPTRHNRVGQAFLGTTAGRVVRQAHQPVLVIRGTGEQFAVGRVLVTADLSELSARAFQAGLPVVRELAGPAAPELRCLWVAEHDKTGTPFRLTEHQILKHAFARLHHFTSHHAPNGTDVTVRVRFGNPMEQIVAEAGEWGADLIVLGTHGRSGLPRLLLGSVAEATLREAGCNVLVIPNPAAAAIRFELAAADASGYAPV